MSFSEKEIFVAGKYEFVDKQNGMTRFSNDFINALLQEGYSVTIIDYFRESEKYNILTKLFGFESEQLSESLLRLRIGIIRAFFFYFKRKIDCIHIITFETNQIFLYVYKSIFKFKVVVTLHALLKHEDEFEQRIFNLNQFKVNILGRLLYINSTFLVFLSNKQLVRSHRYFKIHSPHVIIPHGKGDRININKTKSGSTLRILYSGGTREVKGFSFVVSILKCLSIDYQAKICGLEISKYSKSVLPNRTDYLGELNYREYTHQLEWADVILIPSKFDTFSFTLLDAIKYSVVPICSNNLGALELFLDMNSIPIIDEMNIHKWVDKLEQLASVKLEYGHLGSVLDFHQLYDKVPTWKEIVNLYQKEVYSKL